MFLLLLVYLIHKLEGLRGKLYGKSLVYLYSVWFVFRKGWPKVPKIYGSPTADAPVMLCCDRFHKS